MATEQDVIDGLTRYYSDLDSSVPVRAPAWSRDRRGARRVSSWRMQLLATAALLLLIIAAGVLIHEARVLRQTNPVTTPSPEVKAYQALTATDEHRFFLASHSACNTTEDTSCPAAIAALLNATQRWRDDLDRSLVPERFAPVEAEVRQNMTAIIGDLTAMQAAFQVHDQNRLDAARNAGAAVDQLLNDEGNDIAYAHQGTTATYRGWVHSQVTQLNNCGLCQTVLTQDDAGCISDVASCSANIEATRITVEEIQGNLVQQYAPDDLASKEASLQADLTHADAALTALTALLNTSPSPRPADLAGAHQALGAAIARFISDASKI
jgi:hypothetical protein